MDLIYWGYSWNTSHMSLKSIHCCQHYNFKLKDYMELKVQYSTSWGCCWDTSHMSLDSIHCCQHYNCKSIDCVELKVQYKSDV